MDMTTVVEKTFQSKLKKMIYSMISAVYLLEVFGVFGKIWGGCVICPLVVPRGGAFRKEMEG